MIDISSDLQVTQPTVTIVGNKFVSYLWYQFNKNKD